MYGTITVVVKEAKSSSGGKKADKASVPEPPRAISPRRRDSFCGNELQEPLGPGPKDSSALDQIMENDEPTGTEDDEPSLTADDEQQQQTTQSFSFELEQVSAAVNKL